MAQAHIAALLPTQNRVVSVDENTTFLAHYDLNEHDVLRGVKAFGETQALKFAGTASSVVEVPHIEAYNMSAITIEAWVRIPSSIAASYRAIVSKSLGGRDFNLYLYSSVTTQITNLHFSSSVWTGGNPALPTPFQPNTWHHIALTVSPTGYVTYYADGVAFGGVQGSPGTVSRISPIKIGADDNFWNGHIGNVRIWRRDLSVTEIKEAMYGIIKNESGLAGYWKLNEGQGTVARDLSPYHNDGIIYNGTWETGNSVFTLRNVDGYFGGGALAVEESTTNIIPNPTINSYPSVGNGWGTYQTNQYNSGAFFSIGTINSVTNNEVSITWAEGRKFRTYDVVRPQTTGGGLTANTDYFIKMTSDTTFTIHQYDGTQDGSKGFGVHDSIRRDIRIPINATSFPTMWYGGAHKANSGLVKEVIRNGFTNNGVTHDCLRMYTNHTDQTQSWGDYLAYGVNPTINANTQYAVSFYYRAVTPETIGRQVQYQMHNGVGFGYGNFTLQRDWQRYEAVVTSTATGGCSLYWNAGKGVVWEIAEIQVEQKAFATSFTTGTRPASNLVYPTKDILNPEAGTINMWVKFRNIPNSATGWRMLFVTKDGGYTNGSETNQISFRLYNSWDSVRLTAGGTGSGTIGTATVTEGWHMLTATWDRSAPFIRFYVDGVLIGESTNINFIPSTFHEYFYLGKWTTGETYNANHLYNELRIDKVARTAEEISAWYYSNSPFWPRGIYRKPY